MSIRLLDPRIVDQIAAGEVVERPASVVKELVENALDAQATRITVEIQAGGRSLIRVTDDGVGMSRDDALLCLERHATSKIQRAEDLSAIATMGFRGEALPSIASVSRMSLTTRERGSDSPAATQIVINGGKMIEVKEAGAPAGTSMEIRQLFFNLPARRKFLRSEETEYAHIHHYVTLAALAHQQPVAEQHLGPPQAHVLVKRGSVSREDLPNQRRFGNQPEAHGTKSQRNGVAVLSRVGLTEVRQGLLDQPGFQADGSMFETPEPRAVAATCGGIRTATFACVMRKII